MRWIEENTPPDPLPPPFSTTVAPFLHVSGEPTNPRGGGGAAGAGDGAKKKEEEKKREENGRGKGRKKDCGPAENSNVNDSSNRAPNLVRYRKFVDFYSPCPPFPFFFFHCRIFLLPLKPYRTTAPRGLKLTGVSSVSGLRREGFC